jgi:hypothetical protein
MIVMKKTIYLHVGMPKTGTTSIQRFLYENRTALEKKGVFYPPVLYKSEDITIAPPDEKANLTLLYYKGLVCYGDRGNKAKQILRELWHKTYLPQINASKASIVILSAEVLLAYDDVSYVAPLIEILKEDFDVKVIAYLRKPAEYLTSLWGEAAKTNKKLKVAMTIPLEQMMTYSTVPFGNIDYVINLLGAKNVIIRPFEKCQFKNGNLIEDFLDVINLECDGEFKLLKPENESYGRNSCELALLINKLNLPTNRRDDLHSLLSSKKNDLKLIETLSDECIEQITDKYSETLKGLARIYNKDSFFASDYPACYKKDRPAYNSVSFSLEELKFLHEAIDGAYFLAHDSRLYIKIKYYAYRILCNFGSKKSRRAYRAKKEFYKKMLMA